MSLVRDVGISKYLCLHIEDSRLRDIFSHSSVRHTCCCKQGSLLVAMALRSRIQALGQTVDILWTRIFFGTGPPPHSLALASAGPQFSALEYRANYLEDLKDRAIAWHTVPKSRRSLERRMTRRFGSQNWGSLKMIKPNKRIRVDHKTGEPFLLGHLEPKFYAKVMSETKEMQEKIKESFGLGPKDKPVRVIYENEDKPQDPKFRVVEMPKQRPAFFCSNLLQRTGKVKIDDTTTTVRPSNLG